MAQHWRCGDLTVNSVFITMNEELHHCCFLDKMLLGCLKTLVFSLLGKVERNLINILKLLVTR